MTTDQDTFNDSKVKADESSSDSKQNPEYEWIDDCFRVYETRFGLYISVLKDGREVITALHKEVCIDMTRFHLKGEQEGWNNENSRVVNDGVVGGKL